MKVKIDQADKVFSQYIRKRDGRCMRCGSRVKFNDNDLPVSHQCSHYHGRRKESVRFDPDNADCLCYGCHVEWGSTDRQAYTHFKKKQLGDDYDKLTIRANTHKKKDRKMSLIIAKQLLGSL
jgi:hypothetical protein